MTLRASIAAHRDALRRLEEEAMRKLTRAYSDVEGRLIQNLDVLIARIEAERKSGVEVKPGWLFAQTAFQHLVSDLRAHLTGFVPFALSLVAQTQEAALSRAPRDAEEMITIAAGPATAEAHALIAAAVTRSVEGPLEPVPAARNIEHQARERLEAALVAGALVARRNSWQRSLGGLEPVAKVTDAIAFGLATDRDGRRIREDVLTASRSLPSRAAMTLRTESMHAYRLAALERFRSSGVVESWVWMAELDSHTCPACVAMNGTRHDLTEDLASHPCCRCFPAPVTLPWASLGFPGVPDHREQLPGPAEAFDALSEGKRLAILGRARLDAYNSGRISLEDLVRVTHSPVYGDGARASTLAELGLR